MTGSIKIVLGCMFSGKTTFVINECKKWLSISKNVLCINYMDDTRYGDDDYLYTHDKDKIKCVKSYKLKEINDEIIKLTDVIIINEGQFFDDLFEYCVKWCDIYEKNIIVSGLDGDYLRKPFGQIADLIPYCNSITKLNAFCSVCKDGTYAHFTARLSSEKNQIVIGSSNYVAVCRKHYLILNESS
jgi:thymidine kinase